jgi:glycosyltransferase involved in cell wall biosynthesis
MLTAANWTPLKNHAALLPVLEQLREYSWQWRILGDCGEEPQLCRRFSEEAEERGFGERVELWGAVTLEATAREMGAADIYLSPSLLESYGMSVAEAMAAGCAVLAADSGGTAELIRHGEDGLLCGAEDAAQWREALERLLREPEERRRLGDAARQRAAGFPAWQEQAAKLLAAIEEVRSG